MLPKLRSNKYSKDTFFNTFWTGKFVLSVAVLKFLRFKIHPKKKYSCFRKYGWQKKFSPGRPQIYFFTRFSGYILFFSLVSFAFFNTYFFVCLFVCSLFFEIKNVYSDTHSTICGRVSDKKNFTRPIFGNKTTFCFGLNYSFFFYRIKSLTSFFWTYCFYKWYYIRCANLPNEYIMPEKTLKRHNSVTGIYLLNFT